MRCGGQGTGKGKVYGGQTIAEALEALEVEPDFEYTKPRQDTGLRFVHRRLADGDIYWVSNVNDRPEILEASFRVEGKDPELWHADTGVVEPAPYRIANGRTTVPLRLDPNDAVFVVFRKAAAAASRAACPFRLKPLSRASPGRGTSLSRRIGAHRPKSPSTPWARGAKARIPA